MPADNPFIGNNPFPEPQGMVRAIDTYTHPLNTHDFDPRLFVMNTATTTVTNTGIITNTDTITDTDAFLLLGMEVANEARAAAAQWPKFNSAHEGYGVLAEEFRELEEHVFTNQKRRDLAEMRKEAIQVAAMALRFAMDVCDEEHGRR